MPGTLLGSASKLVAPPDGAALLESRAASGLCPALGTGRGPVSGLGLTTSLPRPWASPPCLLHTKGKSLAPWGLAEAGATEGEGTQLNPLLVPPSSRACLSGQGSADTESPALGAHPSLRCVPLGLQEPRSCIHVMTHAAQTVSRPLCVYTCDYNMIVQIPRRPSVCARAVCVCAVCVCFKSPLGGNSFFFPPLPVWL